MKIVTWNINGLRSILRSKQCTMKDFLDSLGADIICLQETKSSKDQLEDSVTNVKGYTAYFSFCQGRTGYSGVATYCCSSCTPYAAEEGLTGSLCVEGNADCIGQHSLDYDGSSERAFLDFDIDREGRAISTLHKMSTGREVVIINVYCPHVEEGKPERMDYKLKFYDSLEQRCISLQDAGKAVIIVGDFNISYNPIDSAYALDDPECFQDTPARQWVHRFCQDKPSEGKSQNLINTKRFIDAYRWIHADCKEAYTCWSTVTGARQTNYGTRIDYIVVDRVLLPELQSCDIQSDVRGSDHCPVLAEVDISLLSSPRPPSLCAGYHSVQQMTLKQFFGGISRKRPLAEITDEKTLPKKAVPIPLSSQDRALLASTSTSVRDGGNGTPPSYVSTTESGSKLSGEWKSLLKGPPKPPTCSGHNELSVVRTVKKDGPNQNRKFYVCARPAGARNNPEARCDYFKWAPK